MRILRLKEVMYITGLGRSSIYQFINDGVFPRSINLGGGRAVGWLASEVDEWIAARVKERDQKVAA
ncbi:MAG: AlpA family transcriptional regulator [Pseudomonadota bacterium]